MDGQGAGQPTGADPFGDHWELDAHRCRIDGAVEGEVKTLLDSGAHVSLSSDWDADPLSPFGSIERAVTRETNAVESVAQAIELVTLDAAYAPATTT